MTHHYWPMTPGSWIDYDVMEITGTWHPEQMALDVNTRRLLTIKENGFQRITCLKSGEMIARVYGDGGIECTEINPLSVLYQDEESGGIVERAGNGGGFCFPGLLLLPNDLTVGTTRDIASGVFTFDDERTQRREQDFYSRNKIVSRGAWGERWTDTVRVGYWERPEVSAFADSGVYNYVFAHGIGPVNFWFGIVGPGSNSTIWAYEYYARNWLIK